MGEAFIISRGGSAGLNFKVVGGASRPTTARENTIWVDTTVDKEALSVISTTQLPYYIKDTTGVVTKPSSNTCYTRYFECTVGHEYRFQMDDGQTVLIASFTEVPNTGVTGTVLYGTGKTNGADTLDYTVTAAEGVTHLGIYCYDSSANDAVPTLTVTDTTLAESLPDVVDMTCYVLSTDEPENAVDGTVLIDIGDTSSISVNVLKRGNALIVYLLGAKQKINGVWANKNAEIYQNGAWISLSPFPMSLIPVTDQSKWESAKGSTFTDEGYINMYANSNDTIDYLEAIDLSTAGEIVITYDQSYTFVPVLNVINATTGNVEFTITGTTSKSMTLDISTAKGLYYLQITSDNHWSDRRLVLKSLDITRRT